MEEPSIYPGIFAILLFMSCCGKFPPACKPSAWGSGTGWGRAGIAMTFIYCFSLCLTLPRGTLDLTQGPLREHQLHPQPISCPLGFSSDIGHILSCNNSAVPLLWDFLYNLTDGGASTGVLAIKMTSQEMSPEAPLDGGCWCP